MEKIYPYRFHKEGVELLKQCKELGFPFVKKIFQNLRQ